jgi:Aspartate racemase
LKKGRIIDMKIGLVYTGTTPELNEMVETEVKKNVGDSAMLMSYQNAEILAKVRESGHVTGEAAALLVDLFMQAVKDGADAILNICSSVGEVADAMQDYAKYSGVPIVRIDEEMCREAVRLGKRIGVLATLVTTMEPTKNTIRRVAREMGKEVVLVDGLIDGAFGLSQEEFKKRMLEKAGEIEKEVDVILFCQGSMAYCEELIFQTYHKPVLSSPRFGAVALKEALIRKGDL